LATTLVPNEITTLVPISSETKGVIAGNFIQFNANYDDVAR
jgi:hypothetical protein